MILNNSTLYVQVDYIPKELMRVLLAALHHVLAYDLEFLVYAVGSDHR